MEKHTSTVCYMHILKREKLSYIVSCLSARQKFLSKRGVCPTELLSLDILALPQFLL